MHKILIIEDSRSTARMMASAIAESIKVRCDIATNMTEAEALIMPDPDAYFVVLCDLNLPDAPYGEAVDMVLQYGLSCVVVTATLDDFMRTTISKKDITDYVVKRGTSDIQYLVHLIERMIRNSRTKVLVVDDSRTYREQLVKHLQLQKLNALVAEDGKQALDVLEANKDIKLVLTDYHMPNMNGRELTRAIRKKYSADEMAIIAITVSEEELAPIFLKSGANDFVPKMSSFEELACRINMNLDMLELIRKTRELAERDALTGLYNRRMLYQLGKAVFAPSGQKPLGVAMLDIDHFKSVNDTYGHHGGDEALRVMGALLAEYFPEPCVVARYGGEEFSILFPGEQDEQALAARLDAFRQAVELSVTHSGEDAFSYTVSIGVTAQPAESLENMFNVADALLYEAKNAGRNRVHTLLS